MSSGMETDDTESPMETAPLRYVYVLIVPNPYATGSFGIRRGPFVADKDGLGKYYFWIKVGDSDNPDNRVDNYMNQNQASLVTSYAIWKFEDAPPRPGKKLESAHLKKHIRGGLASGSKTEWRALYARDRKVAFALGQRLSDFIRGIGPGMLFRYKDVPDSLAAAVEGTFTGTGNVEQLPKHPRISVVVQPSIGVEDMNLGFAWDAGFYEERDYADLDKDVIFHAFQVSIALSNTRHPSLPDYVAETYGNLCPDVSYNGFSVEELSREERRLKFKSVQTKLMETLGATVSNASYVTAKSIWFDLSFKNDKNLKENVWLLRDFVTKFHSMK
ncbi:hypothetical protein FS749_016518 [Ceratobasidium sp. UAMH 11750]|nr:hypothetical protein FS749_016518 [Ceratobasidium sp. UAMH 11750]